MEKISNSYFVHKKSKTRTNSHLIPVPFIVYLNISLSIGLNIKYFNFLRTMTDFVSSGCSGFEKSYRYVFESGQKYLNIPRPPRSRYWYLHTCNFRIRLVPYLHFNNWLIANIFFSREDRYRYNFRCTVPVTFRVRPLPLLRDGAIFLNFLLTNLGTFFYNLKVKYFLWIIP